MPDFKDFFNNDYRKVLDNQSERILKDFSGEIELSQLAGMIIAENNQMLIQTLKSYNDWLLKNFDIRPKS